MAQILIAESKRSSLHLFLEERLKRAGHDVDFALGGAAALGHIQDDEKSYDLLLTDITMEEMDGVALAKQAQILHPALKIAFITGFSVVVLNKTEEGHAKLGDPLHINSLPPAVDRLLAA